MVVTHLQKSLHHCILLRREEDVIYLISSNLYLIETLKVLFIERNTVIHVISPHGGFLERRLSEMRPYSNLVIDTNDYEIITKILMHSRVRNLNPVFLVDVIAEKLHGQSRLISIKYPIPIFMERLLNSFYKDPVGLGLLTRRQVHVIREVAKGSNGVTMAKNLNISIKTVSSHKLQGLEALGFDLDNLGVIYACCLLKSTFM